MSSISSPLSPGPTSSSSIRPGVSSAQRTNEARAAFVASLTSVGESLDSDLQSRARTIHENARALTEQEKKLAKSTKQLQKDTVQLEKFVQKSTKGGKGAMAEFDDLEGLLGDLEGELDVLEETLASVEGDIEGQQEDAEYEEHRVEAGEHTGGMEGVQYEQPSTDSPTSNAKGKQPEVQSDSHNFP